MPPPSSLASHHHPATPTVIKLETIGDAGFAAAELDVVRVEGHEAISELYRWDVTLRPHDPTTAATVDPDEMLGTSVRLAFINDDGFEIRTVLGIISSARTVVDGGLGAGASGSHATITYRIDIVPRLSRLGLMATQEIFMGMSVVEIIQDKLDRMAPQYCVFRTSDEYPKREFVVQYRETDLAFVRRLAEHAGLAFHFEVGEGESERIVFSDRSASMPDHRDRTLELGPREERHAIHELATTSREIPSLFAVQDYNYRNPRLDLGVFHELEKGAGGIVEYGTHHKTPEEGERLAKARAQEALLSSRVHRCKGIIGWFSAGDRFRITNGPFPKEGDLVVARVRHVAEPARFAEQKDTIGYENEIEAVSAAVPYRPPRITPKPKISGFITGVVQSDPAGPGLEAQLDDEGRYLVQFHFDTTDHGGLRASRRLRMAQPFAGPSQGMHFPLTPNTEVIIAFADGDPDRPLIIGAVPNPITPNHVTAADAHMHRIQARGGVVIEFGRSAPSK